MRRSKKMGSKIIIGSKFGGVKIDQLKKPAKLRKSPKNMRIMMSKVAPKIQGPIFGSIFGFFGGSKKSKNDPKIGVVLGVKN